MEDTILSAEHTVRKNIKPGLQVAVVEKQNQRSGLITTGQVKDILTPGQIHPRGIKVRLTTGQVGRVQKILRCSR
jgi:uncharacterized repeat protein (TIGR03833 family)